MATYGVYSDDKVAKVKTESLEHTSGGTVGFYGTTPIAQRSSAVQASFTITIGTSQTSWGFASSDQFNSFVNQFREIRNTLVAYGLWAGS